MKLTREVIIPPRASGAPRMLLATCMAVGAAAALMLGAQLWATDIAARRRAAEQIQPWPCEYDRGVLAACVGHTRDMPIVRR